MTAPLTVIEIETFFNNVDSFLVAAEKINTDATIKTTLDNIKNTWASYLDTPTGNTNEEINYLNFIQKESLILYDKIVAITSDSTIDTQKTSLLSDLSAFDATVSAIIDRILNKNAVVTDTSGEITFDVMNYLRNISLPTKIIGSLAVVIVLALIFKRKKR